MPVAVTQTLTKRRFQNPTVPLVGRTDDAGRPRVFDAGNWVFSETLLRKCPAQNVAAGVAGFVVPVLWFGMDWQGTASKEATALQSRQQYLATLAEQRHCGEPEQPAPKAAAAPPKAKKKVSASTPPAPTQPAPKQQDQAQARNDRCRGLTNEAGAPVRARLIPDVYGGVSASVYGTSCARC